jgi:hypothetical protein
MDSTNGHSEKNPKKRKIIEVGDENFKLEQIGDVKKIELEDLPWEEQEKIRNFMEITGEEELPELYMIDVNLKVSDLSLLPFEILTTVFRDSLVDQDFESAADYREEIRKRGYVVNIKKDKIIFTLER